MRCTLRGSQGAAHKGIEGFVCRDEEFEFNFQCIGKPLEGCMVEVL